MVWILAAAMLGACLFVLLWSLKRARSEKPPGSDADVAFYRAQLDEIARQAQSGMLAPAEQNAAAAEAARRLLAAAKDRGSASPTRASPTALRVTIVLLLLAVPAVSLSLYARLGSPEQAAMPLAERTLPDRSKLQLAAFISEIEARLAAQPDDARGLALLAPLYLRDGRADDAVRTLAHLIEVAGSSAERQADLGEAIAAANQGRVTPEAKAAFERALAERPDLQKAQFYLGRAYAQSGDAPKARAIFTALLSKVPERGPLHALIDGEIAGLAADGPGADRQKDKLQ